MADIQADIDKLNNFASAITSLVSELKIAGFVPAELSAGSPKLDIGQHIENFKDAVDLFTTYDTDRGKIIGDAQATPGSFADFVGQLTLLASVATQIAKNYQTAGNEDQYSAQMVDAALNPAPASPAG